MTARSIKPRDALPFAISFLAVPMIWLGASLGGWWLMLVPVYGWYTLPLLDWIAGRDGANADTETPVEDLFWHRAITIIWFPIQATVIFGALIFVATTGHLAGWEKITLFAGVGVISGSIGINFSHELMHQQSRLERLMGDLLLASVMYAHFRSEHLLVHHTYVGTPKDAVTANYGEGFWRFFLRVLPGSFRSALRAEAARLKKTDRSNWNLGNPFWRYGIFQIVALILAFTIGGAEGLALFLFQALVAVFQLELINYVEHYGLTRQMGENGKYEPVQPRHSWNANQRVSNWYLINLQRHSDHHSKPSRQFPLLQTHDPQEAPELPAGYPVMTFIAVFPSWFRKVMNPRVRAWRKLHYPQVTDWPKMVRA